MGLTGREVKLPHLLEELFVFFLRDILRRVDEELLADISRLREMLSLDQLGRLAPNERQRA